jgi:nucleotide-binding universal stress UspA family protein
MEEYRRIGVFLSGASTDDVALAFAGRTAELARSEKIVCVRVHGGPEAPDAGAADVDEVRKHVLDALPESVRNETEVEVHSGAGVAEILRCARDHDLDLIVKGRRLPAHQAAVGAAFTRLARKSPCSVLVVPNYCRPHVSRLLVAVDRSNHSRSALETALSIARTASQKGESAQVLVHNVYSIGYGYHKLGIDFQQAMAQRGAAAQKQLDEFVSELDTSGVEFDTVCTCSEDVAGAVHEMAAARKMDMIVVGSRGLSRAAAVVLGGTAEQVLVNAAQPVLIVKHKGETTGLLNALLNE